jgi:5'-phosphate synthase pdxT subunit
MSEVAPSQEPTESRGGRKVGVLALQGDFQAHQRLLEALGAEVVQVRRPRSLKDIQGLVIPGGESTTLLKLMAFEPGWWEALREFHARSAPIFGTCAGMILLATEVTNPAQESIGLLDVTVERNSYGRQVDSFVDEHGQWLDGRPLSMVFIRAPRVTRIGPNVEVLARQGDDPVLIRQGSVLAASFHPEINGEQGVHRSFLEMVAASGRN